MSTIRLLAVATILSMAFFSACAGRVQRVDDAKLSGVPAEQLDGVKAAQKELAMAKVEAERAREQAQVAAYKLRIVKAALEVAEAQANQAEEEFALARFRNDDGEIVAAGDKERTQKRVVRKAEFDVVTAQAKLEAAKRKVSFLEAKVDWLDAKRELERAKVALRYDQGTPNEKSAVLTDFESAVLATELSMKEAEGDLKRALVEVEAAERDRKALDN